MNHQSSFTERADLVVNNKWRLIEILIKFHITNWKVPSIHRKCFAGWQHKSNIYQINQLHSISTTNYKHLESTSLCLCLAFSLLFAVAFISTKCCISHHLAQFSTAIFSQYSSASLIARVQQTQQHIKLLLHKPNRWINDVPFPPVSVCRECF